MYVHFVQEAKLSSLDRLAFDAKLALKSRSSGKTRAELIEDMVHEAVGDWLLGVNSKYDSIMQRHLRRLKNMRLSKTSMLEETVFGAVGDDADVEFCEADLKLDAPENVAAGSFHYLYCSAM